MRCTEQGENSLQTLPTSTNSELVVLVKIDTFTNSIYNAMLASFYCNHLYQITCRTKMFLSVVFLFSSIVESQYLMWSTLTRRSTPGEQRTLYIFQKFFSKLQYQVKDNYNQYQYTYLQIYISPWELQNASFKFEVIFLCVYYRLWCYTDCGTIPTVVLPTVVLYRLWYYRLWYYTDCGTIPTVVLYRLWYYRLWYYTDCGTIPTVVLPTVVLYRLWYYTDCGTTDCGTIPTVVLYRLWYYTDCGTTDCGTIPTVVLYRLWYYTDCGTTNDCHCYHFTRSTINSNIQ